MRYGLACVVAVSLVARAVAGDSWPQFRGPDGQGHSDSVGLPLTWSESEHVLWKSPIAGHGWSSPVIEDGRIWLTMSTPDGRSLRAIGVDGETGEIVRDVEVLRPSNPPAINGKNTYASPTPIVAGERLYVHFGTMGTACLSTATGEVLWRNETLHLDHKEGPGSSPALVGDLLIVPCDGMDVQYVVALDVRTGEVVWKTDRTGTLDENPDFRKAYSTPLAIEVNGRKQVLSTGADQTIAYDPATGEEIWKVRCKGFSTVPRPLYGDGLVYIATSFLRPEFWAVRPDGQGDVTETHIVWQATRQAPASPSALLVGDEIYMISDAGIVTCLDSHAGDERWTKRLGGNFSASPLYADGKIFLLSEEGLCHVIEPGTTYRSLATNQLDGRFLASPAVSGKALYLRTDTHLYRIEE